MRATWTPGTREPKASAEACRGRTIRAPRMQLGSVPFQPQSSHRSLWHRTGQQIAAGSVYQHPFVQECQLSQWRDALRVSTALHMGAFLQLNTLGPDEDFQVCIMWINEEFRMQSFIWQGDFRSIVQLWLSYVQLEFHGISVQLFVEHWVCEAFLTCFNNVHALL